MYLYPKKVAEAKIIARDVATLGFWFGVLMLVPMAVGMLYGEASWYLYIPLFAFTSGISLLFQRYFKRDEEPFTRMTVVTLAITWLMVWLFGSLPFFLVGGMGPLDALFESVSSISTAGLTNIQGVETIPNSVLFWRALLAWLGGIGITAVAFHSIMQSESVSKIVLGEGFDRLKPSLANSAKEIAKIYAFWTALGVVVLVLIGAPVFDSFNISMNAISTTGVDVHSEGWGYYQRTMPDTFPIMAAVTALLMVMGAVSFIAHYRVLKNRRLRAYFEDRETLAFFAILAVGMLLVGGYLFLNGQDPAPLAYEALSTSTTGGFEITPHITAAAGDFIMAVLIVLSLIGGCTNSAAGGLKVKRIYVMFKYFIWKAGRQISPKGAVSHFKYQGRKVGQSELADIASYFFIYGAAIIIVASLMVGFQYDAVDSVLTVTSAQAGGGVTAIPGWELNAPVKAGLIGTMLFGRLEFIPLFALAAYALKRR